ncbi:MAG: hypothetical protein PVI07_18560 [Anaerolineae bacterium]|jgi:hypothetical protein
MNVSDIISLHRPLDFDYVTNRAIAIVTIVVMAGGAVFQFLSGGGWGESTLWGARAGLSVFLTWALCRELDPDHAFSAFVAAGLALAGLFFWGPPRLGVILWLIAVMRVVNRTTGAPAGLLDSLGVLGLGSWLSLRVNWGYGVITALAFLLDSQLPQRARRQLVPAFLGVIATGIAAIVGRKLAWEGPPSVVGGLIGLALSALFLPVVLSARHLTSVGDRSQQRLEPNRVQAAQILALLTGVETAILGGMDAIGALVPLWAAVLGASITWLYLVVRR